MSLKTGDIIDELTTEKNLKTFTDLVTFQRLTDARQKDSQQQAISHC